MAMTVGGSRRGISAEINVVPLIGILLVLLVTFMILPHSQKGLDAVLSQARTDGCTLSPAEDLVIIQVLNDGSLRVSQEPVRWEKLQDRRAEVFKVRGDRTAFVRADDGLEFQVVARAIDVMGAAGISTIGLLTGKLEYAR